MSQHEHTMPTIAELERVPYWESSMPSFDYMKNLRRKLSKKEERDLTRAQRLSDKADELRAKADALDAEADLYPDAKYLYRNVLPAMAGTVFNIPRFEPL